MSNYGALAVLAELRTHEARLRTARTYSLLIALETFPAGADGWREVGAELLCESAGLAQSTFRQARGELIGAKLIEYRPGARRGERSRWRITFRVEEPPGKGAAQSGTLRKGAAQSGASTTLKGGHTRPGKGAGPGPERVPDPNRAVAASPGTLTSPNAAPEPDSGRSTALEPSALGSSALSARARDPRTLLLGLGADETEIELIAASIEADPDIRDPWVYVLTVIGNGDGPAWLDRKRRDLASRRSAATAEAAVVRRAATSRPGWLTGTATTRPAASAATRSASSRPARNPDRPSGSSRGAASATAPTPGGPRSRSPVAR